MHGRDGRRRMRQSQLDYTRLPTVLGTGRRLSARSVEWETSAVNALGDFLVRHRKKGSASILAYVQQ